MMITKRALSRRTVLRGMGATIGLPLLDAMVPALTATAKTAAKPTKRITFIFQGNGVIPTQYTPSTAGKNFELSRILQPLAPVKDYLTVVSGTAHLQANSFGEGNSEHVRSTAVWLTGVHAYDRKTSEVSLATSVDQLIAQHIGKDSALTSLEMSLDGSSLISCDATDCFYQNTISWRSPSVPNPMEHRPRAVFERLFGEGATSAERQALRRKQRSILDSVAQEAARFKSTLGNGDQLKLTEYLESVRDIERRIQNAEANSARGEVATSVPSIPDNVESPDNFSAYWGIMCDLLVVAHRMDATRVATIRLAADSSGRSYPQIGVPEGGHFCSHHRRQPELMEKRARILTYHEQLQSEFLQKLRNTQDGDGNLLDHSLVVAGSGMGDGDLHDHVNLPLWIAGKAGGALPGNVHVEYPVDKAVPLSNLWLTVMDLMDVPAPDTFGDSTGRLAI